MDAIQFLKQEHKKAKAGLKKVLKASPDTRGDLWNELQPELEAHEQIEDACLYGPLARGAGKVDAKLAAWRAKHQKEVQRVEGLVGQLESLDPAQAAWVAKVKAIGSSAAAQGSAMIAHATMTTSESPKLYSERPPIRKPVMAAMPPTTRARSATASAGSRRRRRIAWA